MRRPFSAPASAGAGALLCALFLAGCSRPGRDLPPAATDGSLNPPGAALRAQAPAASDPLAAARSPSSTATAAEVQAVQDVQDNTRARALAAELVAHPDWLARQAAICAPGNATLQARYAALQGAPPQDLRDLKVACIAKDIAEQEARERAAGGGVANTRSL